MFYSWSDRNKITSTELQIQYTGAYSATRNSIPVYEFHRIATKEYRYVGMTEAAAKACQAAKLQQYTRKFTQWYNENGGYSKMRQFICVADVSMDSDEDGLWTVNISINEDQLQYYAAMDVTQIPYWLFDQTLDYDEEPAEGGYLRISSVWRENARLYIAYEQNIEGFDRTSNQFLAEHYDAEENAWFVMTPTSSTQGQMYFNSGAWQQGLVRLRWGNYIVSNSEQTPETEYENTLVLYSPPYWQIVGGVNGSWRVQFEEDFPNFNPDDMVIEARMPDEENFTDITTECVIEGDRIITPYITETSPFFLRATYNGVTSNVVDNMFAMFEVNGVTATKNNNLVDVVTVSFSTTLENVDTTKFTVKYSDHWYNDKIFYNESLTINDDGEGNYTASFNVGNQIYGSSMQITTKLRYSGTQVGQATTTIQGG